MTRDIIPSEMAVRVIGSWYYTSELPADEAATLRAAMVSKDCESLETWLKTSVHDADRKARLYALLRHAAFESWLAGLELLIRYNADVNPPAGGGRRDGALDGARLGPTPLHYAAASKESHQVAVVDLLLAAGADASSTPSMHGSSVLPPLHFAVSLGRRESEVVKDRRYQVVVHLLRHGARANAEDANHVTAEARARQYRQFRCEKLLRAVRIAGGSWEQYCGPRYELVALRALCAGDAPRAVWAGGDERLLKNLFAAELPDELFRKVITFWAPVWR